MPLFPHDHMNPDIMRPFKFALDLVIDGSEIPIGFAESFDKRIVFIKDILAKPLIARKHYDPISTEWAVRILSNKKLEKEVETMPPLLEMSKEKAEAIMDALVNHTQIHNK